MHAHRGEPSLAPQNTRESIKLAFDLGARMIETDCHLTEEGEMIIMHGRKEAKEVWGLDKDPKTITLKEVKNSRLAHPENYDAKYANCRMPTLEELFAVMPKDKKFEVEIKTYGPEFAKKLDDARAKYGLKRENIYITSFQGDAVKDFKKQYPDYTTLFIVHMKKDKEGKLPYTAESLIAKAKDLGVEQVALGRYRNVDREFVKKLQDAGFVVGIWQVENLDDLAYAAKLKVDRICSNFASKLRDEYNTIKNLELK